MQDVRVEKQIYLFLKTHAACNANRIHVFPPYPSTSNSLPILRLLERVSDLIIFPQIDLFPLLRHLVLDKHLLRMLCHKLSYEPWIPQLTRYTEIFAATS